MAIFIEVSFIFMQGNKRKCRYLYFEQSCSAFCFYWCNGSVVHECLNRYLFSGNFLKTWVISQNILKNSDVDKMHGCNWPNESIKKDSSHGESGRNSAGNLQSVSSLQCSGFTDTHITFRKKIPAFVPFLITYLILISNLIVKGEVQCKISVKCYL